MVLKSFNIQISFYYLNNQISKKQFFFNLPKETVKKTL